MALPLSLAAMLLLGSLLLPALPVVILLLIACVIVPTDFAPAETLVRDTRIAARVRNVRNVESGYNDGIVSPIFLFALILAGATTQALTPMQALGTALPSAAKALIVGILLGPLLAWLMNSADRTHRMTEQSRRILVLVAPLLAYTITVAAGGNDAGPPVDGWRTRRSAGRTGHLSDTTRPERYVTLYRNGAEWKIRAAGQGYASAPTGIARDFGASLRHRSNPAGRWWRPSPSITWSAPSAR